MTETSEEKNMDLIEKTMRASIPLRQTNPQKCSDIAFFPLNNLPEKTMPHVKEALEAYFHGQNFIVS